MQYCTKRRRVILGTICATSAIAVLAFWFTAGTQVVANAVTIRFLDIQVLHGMPIFNAGQNRIVWDVFGLPILLCSMFLILTPRCIRDRIHIMQLFAALIGLGIGTVYSVVFSMININFAIIAGLASTLVWALLFREFWSLKVGLVTFLAVITAMVAVEIHTAAGALFFAVTMLLFYISLLVIQELIVYLTRRPARSSAEE